MDETKRTTEQGGKSIYAEQGDVYVTYAGERHIPHALTPPPFQPEIFLGREDELQQIHDRLFTGGGNLLLLVNGEGGVGKTSIASRYYRDYQDKYAHVAWVLSEKSIASALLQLAMPLGLQFDDKQDTRQRFESLLTALADLYAPCLLVIDNANEVDDLEAHYQHLRRCSNFHLLLTTRITQFEQAQTCAIGALPDDQALDLFQTYYRNLDVEEQTLFQDIRTAVGGNTLVLELLAKNLAAQNRLRQNYSLAQLLADLQRHGVLKLSQSKPVGTDYQSRGTMRREKPEAVIAAMYDLTELPCEEKALLSVFAVLPAERISFDMLKALLPGTDALDDHLLSLVQQGWVEHHTAEAAFKCSPVVQQIVREKNVGLYADCASLIQVLIDKLEYAPDLTGHLLNTDYSEALIFARYGEAALTVLEPNPDYNQALLSECVGRYHVTTGNLTKGLQLFDRYKTICSKLLADTPNDAEVKNLLAISCQFLGYTYTVLGNLQQALTFFEQYNQLEKELFDAYPQNVEFKKLLAISCQFLGNTHTALGNLDQALIVFEIETKLFEELFEAYPQNVEFKNGLAVSYQLLGNTHTVLDNLDEALTYFEKDIELTKELFEAYPQNVSFKNGWAISSQYLGTTHTLLGNLQQALTFFEQFNQLEKELFEAYPNNVSFKNGLAISCQLLGNTHTALGNLEQALTFFEQYNQLEKELCSAYPENVEFTNTLAISYIKLGWFNETQLQNPEQATMFYVKSKQLLQELVDHYPAYVKFRKNLDWVKSAIDRIEIK